MTLLSPLALLLGLAAIVPIVLHLRRRQRRTTIEFSTDRFFTQAIVRAQRRMRIQRWVLLALRVAACVLLALALSQPILDLAGIGGSSGRRDLVVVLDDSLSMQASSSTGNTTAFTKARDMTLLALEHLQPTDRVAIVTTTGRTLGSVQSQGVTFDAPQNMAAKLRELSPTFAVGDAHQALTKSAALLASSPQRQPLVLMLSDLQQSDWRDAPWPQPLGSTPMFIAQVALPPSDNLAVEDIALGQASPIAGQPGVLRVRVFNHRAQSTQADLIVKLDDQEIVRRPVQWPGQSPRVELVPLKIDQPGLHRVSCELVTRDALPADNRHYATLMVQPRLPVLIVDGRADREPRQSSAFFLRAALLASSESGGMQPDVVRFTDLSSVRLDGYRVVLLCEVPQLPLPQVEQLEQFVKSGGGLCVLPGQGADLSFYNETLGSQTRPYAGLMPATLHSMVGGAGSDASMHVLDAELDHPVLERFKGNLRGSLSGVSMYRAYALGSPRHEAQILATMDQGLPWIVERPFGRGRVLLFALPPQPTWTNLPLRRVFIPLMSRTVSYLSGGESSRSHDEVHNEIILARGGWDQNQPVHVQTPSGQRVQASVRAQDGQVVAFLPGHAVEQPGWYQVQWPGVMGQSGSSRTGLQNALAWVFAANVSVSESKTESLSPELMQKQAGSWRVLTASATLDDATMQARILSWLDEARAGRAVWDALLWLVLVVLLIEPVVANLFTAGRRWSAQGLVTSLLHRKAGAA